MFNTARQRVTPIALVGLALLPVGAGAQSWYTYQVDASHTGHVQVATEAEALYPVWQAQLGDRWLNQVTIADGMVFASHMYGWHTGDTLWALRTSDGGELWRKSFGELDAISSAAYAGGQVYLQTGKGYGDWTPKLRVFQAATGAEAFEVPWSAQWEYYHAPTPYAGDVYIGGGYYGGMYGFYGSVNDPQQRWWVRTPQYDEWAPAVDGQFAYAYTQDLRIVDRITGELVATVPDPNFDWQGWSVRVAPVLTGPYGLVVTQSGRLINFDTWSHTIRYEIDDAFAGQPAYADGVIFVINGGDLTARRDYDGYELWTWDAPEQLVGTVLVSDTHVFCRSALTTYAVSRATREMVWSYPQGGQLSFGEGHLFIAKNTGLLIALKPQPFARLQSEDLRVAEESGTVEVTVVHGGAAHGGLTVSYGTLAGSAEAGTDFTPVSGTLTWGAGDSSPRTISVPILSDAEAEGDETFTVRILSPVGGFLSSPSTSTITIEDDDTSTLQLEAAQVAVDETSASALLLVHRRGGSGYPVSVSYATGGGTAIAGMDYQTRSGTLSWPAGDDADRTITVPLVDDLADEGPETFNVSLSSPSTGAVVGAPAQTLVTIIDDEHRGVAFSPTAAALLERDGSVLLTVLRSGNSEGAVTVDWATSGDTATSDVDFASASGTLEWADLELGAKTLEVTVLQDLEGETDESFLVELFNPSGGAVVDIPTAVVTIHDDDQCWLQFAEGAVTVPEETGTFQLRIERVGGDDGEVSVGWRTVEGSARSGVDFADAAGLLTWLDGELGEKPVALEVLGDALNEGAESFTVELYQATGAGSVGSSHSMTVTIADDERAEVRVNATREWAQTRPAAACDALGRSVVVWDSDRQDGDGWGVFARRLDVGGTPQVAELVVNTTTASHQKNVEVAANPDGRFVVVWEGLGQDGNLSGVAGRIYSADGTPTSGELALNATVAGDQQRPSVAMRPDGSFVAAWQSYGQDGSGWGVYARRFDAAGVPLGGELPVNVATVGDQSYPDVTVRADGGFAVSWQHRPTDGDADVRLRLFNAAGAATTGEVAVNATIAGEQREPSIAAGGDGTVWVAWEAGSDQDGSGYGVFARRFDAAGAPLTEEVQLNLYTVGDQSDVSLAIDRSTGRGTALWQSDGQDGAGLGVFARTLLSDGTWHDTEQAVNSTTVENQHSPAATRCGGGRFTLTWASYDQDNWYDAVIAIVGSDSDWVFGDGLEAACTDAWSGAAGVTP